MKKKKETTIRTVIIKPNTAKWQLHQKFEQFVNALDRTADARDIQRNPPRSAPAELVSIIF